MVVQCQNHYLLVVLTGWKMSKIDEDFIKNYDKDSDKGCILKLDIKYPKNLSSDLPFLPERMKIDKCNKLVCNLYDKKTMLFM